MNAPRLLLRLAVALALSLFGGTAALAAPVQGAPTLAQRLDRLAETLEAAREAAHVPGMSIAIVKDDEVVFARGFGLADRESQRPAGAETIYAVGSTTKAFTATLLGMLVDEDKAHWDDPVTKYLPYFDLRVRSEEEHAECTLRDLLSHRHGFARMSLLWAGGGVSRDEVLHTAAGAEPWDDFRAGFHYCNVAYLAAGVAAGVAADSTWDELIAERLFEPLGMTSSSITLAAAKENPRLALGYAWEESDGTFERRQMMDLAAIGPAGAVNSNVLDMAQWVRLQLGRGTFHGAGGDLQLISSERLEETWEPQIQIADGVSYGLGWMLQERSGRRIVEHGGNIDGFSAEVGLMPDEQLGFVLLMNLDVSPLQQSSLAVVFDALLEDWPSEVEQSDADAATRITAAIDFEDYVGTYLANFATFRDEEFEVLVQDGQLALDIPSQQTFALRPPDETGKWGFVLTDTIAVSFERDDAGRAVVLTVHQGGYSFEVPREGFEFEPEVPAAELEKYVGTYERAQGGKHIELFVLGGRLTMEDKGRWIPLHTPDAEGHAALRPRPDQGATFQTDAEGRVESLVFHGTSGDQLFTRLLGEAEADLPSLAELLTLRDTDARRAAETAAGGTRTTGTIWVAQAGIRGTFTLVTQGKDRYAQRLDFGKFGRIETAARGERAWSYSSMRGFETLKGDELTQALLGHPAAVDGDWSDYFDSIEVVRTETVGERSVVVVRLKHGDFPSRTYAVDAETGDVLRVNQPAIEGAIRIPLTITFSDFAELDGLRTARRTEIENEATGRMVLTTERIESGLELGDEVFTLVDPERAKQD